MRRPDDSRARVDEIDVMMASGVAHSGMVAKLGACRLAFASGVTDISIVAGRGRRDYASAAGTRLDRREQRRSVGDETKGVEIRA